MRNHKKSLSVMLGLALSLSLLAGCGTEKTAEKQQEEKQEEKIDYDKYVTLGEYKTITLKKSNIDAQVETQVDELLQNYATYDKITKGKVKDGDTVNIYYVGKVDGKEFEGGSLTKEENPEGYDLTIGSHSFIDGFEEALIGKKIGKTYDIDVTFPENYPSNQELAGKAAVFTVTINSKQGKEHLPELNDEFVSKNLSEYDSAEAYKQDLRDNAVQEQAWSELYKSSEIKDYPESKLKETEDRLMAGMEYSLKQQGATVEDYIKAQGITQEQFDAQKEEAAKKNVAEWLVYSSVAEKENIKVTEEEYDEAIKEIMEANNLSKEEEVEELFKNYYGSTSKEVLSDDLLAENVREYLGGNVKEE